MAPTAAASQTRSHPAPHLVDAAWLKSHLGEPKLRVLDASWHLPTSGREGKQDFVAGHIPGAAFFDIDAISDSTRGLPHMLPAPANFAAAVGKLGIATDDTIVIYDTVGLFSAPRVWWSFRAMGATDVHVLDGGLPAWVAAGGTLARGPAMTSARTFVPAFDATKVASLDDVKAALTSGSAVVADARPADRFIGTTPEPRPGLRCGHMPGARNLPFTLLIENGRMKPAAEIARLFAEAGIDTTRPIITSCGSGVTAAVLSLALATIGVEDVRLYDGSWTEWGGKADVPVVTGPAT